MSLNRRQFLLTLGASGFGLSACLNSLKPGSGTPSQAAMPQPSGSATAQLFSKNNLLASKGIVNPPRGDLRLVVISDLNSQYGSTDYEPEVDKAIALIPGWQPDLVLCGGDMVAGQSPSLSRAQIQAMWQAFDQHVAAPLRRAKIPFGFTLGNHDASGSLGLQKQFLFAQERDLAAAYWRNPRHDPGLQFLDRAHFPFYYTFVHRNVFFLSWDASTAQISRQQLEWVERSLSSPAAQAARLRMVIGHLPLYAIAIGRDDPGEYLNNADALQSLLEKHRVHTYISGHHHAYYPGHVGKLQTLQCGILGAGMRPLLVGGQRTRKTLTVVDINLQAADTVYTTYDVMSMQLLAQNTLPRLIPGPNGTVLRRDIEVADLTPAERTLKYQPGEK